MKAIKILLLLTLVSLSCGWGWNTTRVTGLNGAKNVNTSKIQLFPGMSKQSLQDILGEPLEVTSRGSGFEDWKYLIDRYPYGNVPIIFKFDGDSKLINYYAIDIRQSQQQVIEQTEANQALAQALLGIAVGMQQAQQRQAIAQQQAAAQMAAYGQQMFLNSQQRRTPVITPTINTTPVTPISSFMPKATLPQTTSQRGEFNIRTPGYGTTNYQYQGVGNQLDVMSYGPGGSKNVGVEITPLGRSTLLTTSQGRQLEVTTQPNGDVEVQQYGNGGGTVNLIKEQ